MSVMGVFRATLELVLLVSLTHSQDVLQPDPVDAKAFYILEEALLSDNVTLYQLQQLFYPSDGVATVTALITINMTWCDGFESDSCGSYESFTYSFLWTSPAGNKHSELQRFLFSRPIYSAIDYSSTFLLSYFTSIHETGNIPNSAIINLHIFDAYAGINILATLASLVSWMKSYAREPYQKLESDKGVVFDYSDSLQYNNIFLNNERCILVIFVILNLLFLTLTAFYSKAAIHFINKQVYLKTVMEKYYWSTVVVTGLLNAAWFVSNSLLSPILLFYFDFEKILITILLPVIILVIVVPINAGLATRHITIPVPGICEKICCCCCFCCCSKKRMSQLIHTLSLSHILWFIHRLISTSIVVICYFVVAPAQVLAVVSLFFSSIICIIVFSSLIFSSCACTCKYFVRFIGLVFLFLQIIAIIIAFTCFYINLADNGLESDGIGGIFLFLIPPATFFIVGLIVERRFFNKRRNSSGNEDPNVGNNNSQDQEAESSIDGGIQSADNPSGRQHNNVDENTHLLLQE